MGYRFRFQIRLAVFLIASLAVITRLYIAIQDWELGKYTEIQSFAFCVIFPVTLLILLDLMKETKTKEGALMRFGSMIQLLLILCIPSFALYLALGFPVVFFAVEIFCTRIPKMISAPIEKAIIA